MHRSILWAILTLLVITTPGCAGLKKWLNNEPEFMKKSDQPKEDPDRHVGIAGELNDVEYAEYDKVKKQNELDRKSRSWW